MSYRRGLYYKVAVTWTECMNCEISLYLRLCLQVCIHIYVCECVYTFVTKCGKESYSNPFYHWHSTKYF